MTIAVACVPGVPVGVGAFTFVYAKGLARPARVRELHCHVMNEQHDGWLKSGHRHVATCVDCHLPDAGLPKWIAKADHGFRHSMAFTLQNFQAQILAESIDFARQGQLEAERAARKQ